ncbi:MAG: helix-turn-helix domain-containing protein [Candidatus Omnitrophica bacterium]|nr:helix-turn-helix domain-containing protein [Candidatus Omnitrophota bacterium]MDD5027188.1 helix-turn-helix domain-containing protein [Candidatus Omnitrophota bacterium]MDD5662430.1 helix-turn-helix domain-containing protein [Candidatus Omnitrophota bacterium]
MITILIADNELKLKEELEKMLVKVIELGDSIFNEKKGVLYKAIIEAVEKPLLEQVLERTGGNQIKAAQLLGLNRNTLHAKIKKIGINVEKWKT